MIWLLKTGVRTGLVAAAMTVAIPMIAFAQTIKPVIESAPVEVRPAVAKASQTDAENSRNNNTSMQKALPAGPAIPATVEAKIQSRFNELRHELLDDRAETIDWWLTLITIVLGFFGIVVPIAFFTGLSRFRELEKQAHDNVKTVVDIAGDAKRLLKEIDAHRATSEEIVRHLNAQTAADDPKEAKQAVETVLKTPKVSPLHKAVAGAIFLQQEGKRDDAIKKWRAIADIAEGSDNHLAARAWFSIAYLVKDESLENCLIANDQAIRLKPDFAEAYSNRGNTKYALGRYQAAVTDYDEAIRLKPDYAGTYSNRGAAKAATGEHDAAIADYDKAVYLNPGDAGAYSNRGVSKAALRCREAAIADHDEAIRLKPDYAAAYNNRGNAKDELGRHEAAIVDFDQAIRLEPDDAGAYSNRGNAKLALGRYDEAIADHDKAIRLKPDLAGAYSNRGNAKLALGRHNDAISDYDAAIRLQPSYVEAYNNRGNAKAALEQYEAAIADYDEAIRLQASYAVAYNNRGEAKAALERYNAAIADCDEAIRLQPDLAEAYYNRGVAKNALGLKDEAKKNFQTALELARNANNVKIEKLAEQKLRDLATDGGS